MLFVSLVLSKFEISTSLDPEVDVCGVSYRKQLIYAFTFCGDVQSQYCHVNRLLAHQVFIQRSSTNQCSHASVHRY